MSEKAHFHLLGMNTNRTTAIGQTITAMNCVRKVMVWCAVLPFRIMGPHLFEDDSGNVLNVMTGCCVRFFTLQLAGHPEVSEGTWFQQDRVTFYTRKNIHEHWNICFLIVSFLEMGIFHGQRDRLILEHAISFCGAVLIARSSVHHPHKISQTLNTEFRKMLPEFLCRYYAV